MKIRIKENASAIYAKHSLIIIWDYHDMIQAIEGKTIRVETDHLFFDQFNTVPIQNVSYLGLRIHNRLVEKVIGDIRHRYKKCVYCGKQQGINSKKCPKCGQKYFKYLTLKQKMAHIKDYIYCYKNLDRKPFRKRG